MRTPPAMTLPPPSLIEAFVLENPWPIVIGLIIAANVIWLGWRYRSTRPALAGAIMCVVLAIGVGVLGQVVETSAEIVQRQTRAFVEAVMDGDVQTTSTLIGDSARLQVLGQDLGFDADEIRALVARADEAIATNAIRLIDGAATGRETADSVLDQRTSSAAGFAVPNQWRLQWKRTGPGRWQIVTINWLSWDGRRPSMDMWRR